MHCITLRWVRSVRRGSVRRGVVQRGAAWCGAARCSVLRQLYCIPSWLYFRIVSYVLHLIAGDTSVRIRSPFRVCHPALFLPWNPLTSLSHNHQYPLTSLSHNHQSSTRCIQVEEWTDEETLADVVGVLKRMFGDAFVEPLDYKVLYPLGLELQRSGCQC